MQNAKCKMQNVKCKMQNVKCKIGNIEKTGIRQVECLFKTAPVFSRYLGHRSNKCSLLATRLVTHNWKVLEATPSDDLILP
jgi:hypothetical protein